MTQPMIVMATMSDQQRAAFHVYMAAVQKDEVVGVLAAFFLGTFGVHHFYLRRTGLGVLYLIFCWTGIPTLLGFIECFLMPGRVRRYNAEQAQILISAILAGGYPVTVPWGSPVLAPAASVVCGACGVSSPLGVRFCSRCGAAMAA